MADVLVLMPNVVPVVPASPGRWEAGMVVDVFEDGRLNPGADQHPKFFVVRIPGVPADDVRDLLDAMEDLTDPENPVMVKRRALRLDFNTLSRPIQRRIESEREIEVTEAQFRSYMAQVT